MESHVDQVAAVGRHSSLNESSNQESKEDMKRTRAGGLKNEGMNTPDQREEGDMEDTREAECCFCFCDVCQGDECKNRPEGNERISSDMHKRGRGDTWGGEEGGREGSLPTAEAGMGSRTKLAGNLRREEFEQLL